MIDLFIAIVAVIVGVKLLLSIHSIGFSETLVGVMSLVGGLIYLCFRGLKRK